jgi:hypothetical protein
MAAGTTNGAWALAELVAGITAFEMFGRRFEAMPEVRWALGEPSVRGRDTSG